MRTLNCVVACVNRLGMSTLVPVKVHRGTLDEDGSDARRAAAASIVAGHDYATVGPVFSPNQGMDFLFENWDFDDIEVSGDELESEDDEHEYLVRQFETGVAEYRVSARSQAEAVYKVLNGDGGDRLDGDEAEPDYSRGVAASDLPPGFAGELQNLPGTRGRNFFDDGRLSSIESVYVD